ncbi:DUF2840 domain-containing protein [Sphingomonas sp. PB4P5]|uniref:DUF2840 domain-containing protein n=1 Tax=Parasphingomonas puruogangriensis TaxID=3096155 RepID=UPI002FC69CC2
MSGINAFQQSDAVVPPGGQRSPRAGITTLGLPPLAPAAGCWIRFGAPVFVHVFEGHCPLLRFVADSIFAFVSRGPHDTGTALAKLHIVRVVSPGQGYTTLPNLVPGGGLLRHLGRSQKTRACQKLIQAIGTLGVDPCAVALDYWRHVHNRLIAGHRAHAHPLALHRPQLLRRGLRA